MLTKTTKKNNDDYIYRVQPARVDDVSPEAIFSEYAWVKPFPDPELSSENIKTKPRYALDSQKLQGARALQTRNQITQNMFM